MKWDRRAFIQKSLAGLGMMSCSPQGWARNFFGNRSGSSKPWIELSEAAYLHNAAQVSKMAKGKPVVAVLKNNGYGLGAVEVAKILNKSPHIFGMAVVKDEAALAMRVAGVTKPILLMGDFDSSLSPELIEKKITLSVYSYASLDKINQLAKSADTSIRVALYIDTGLGRMGIPYGEATKIAEGVDKNNNLTITQTFSTLTSPRDFALEQISRFQEITTSLDKKGINVGLKHLAPSYSLLDLPVSHEDAVRPGILLHGSFPSTDRPEAQEFPLQIPYRLRASVIRLERLRRGDTIGFSRFYKVEKDEWIATLPVGWADGYNSGAENGAKVLLGNELYPVVNVNASHTNVSLGAKTSVKVGETATLIGPENSAITPEGFGKLVNGHNYLQINYKESIPKHVYPSF